MSQPYPKAVIFDLDGTLVSSSLDFIALRDLTGCTPGADILEHLKSLAQPERDKASNIVLEHEMDDARTSFTLNGTREMLAFLRDREIKTAIITRNSAAAAKLKIERANIETDLVLSREDSKPKPAPDALLYLANLWGFAPEECLYVGDYLYDLDAANAANMHSVLYCEGELPPFASKAKLTYSDHRQFGKILESYWSQVS